ncbi:hypothetical protein [Collinsella provencensis]|uniref:hypothetical protein n=1 Tax=Collinsella provencensis TaxID=1937461 RepID=UPI00131E2B07|nr:hypothetical protein [Collinsella provencensis]
MNSVQFFSIAKYTILALYDFSPFAWDGSAGQRVEVDVDLPLTVHVGWHGWTAH